MFDDLNKKEKAEDLFAETDKTFSAQNPIKPAVFQSKQPAAFGEGAMGMEDEGVHSKNQTKKIIVLAGIVLAAIILIGGGIYAFTVFKKQTPAPSAVEEENNNEPAKTEDENSPAEDNGRLEENTENNNKPADNQNNPSPVPQKIDTDQDGLSDEEEKSLGMDINNPDSDGDGLFDREEAKVYKTDPLNIDTDGDGYSDGEEVKGGYNPKGSGKLFEVK